MRALSLFGIFLFWVVHLVFALCDLYVALSVPCFALFPLFRALICHVASLVFVGPCHFLYLLVCKLCSFRFHICSCTVYWSFESELSKNYLIIYFYVGF